MIFEGVNDIGTADRTTPNQTLTGDSIILAYEQMITRAHSKGISFFGATITPPGAPNTTIQSYGTPEGLPTRSSVNEWIRTLGAFDAVVDFHKVVKNPEDPDMLNPRYNSGDFGYPNEADYHAMARTFPLDVLEEYGRGVSTFM
ncbi:hypothetical protein B0A50_05520 [Salinomyces thailandicus]|uniref:SGNH hydrolase-type esterase domain-containing protein n=1 Tax=Salinomyces thailandicus TaxID=706561 RepID=A0A4U0TUR6_9PEZI|nr:hypothetical protein B0A50_05520 [Salinomyces thailandica]